MMNSEEERSLAPTEAPDEIVAKSFRNDPELLADLFWELNNNVPEFPVGVSVRGFEELACASGSNMKMVPEMRDLMLAEVKVLGHKDKFPRAYQWEELLRVLKPGEEVLWIVSKKRNQQSFALYFGLKFNATDLGEISELANREERFQIFCDYFSRTLFPESQIERLKSSRKEPDGGQSSRSVGDLVRELSREDDYNGVRQFDKVFCVTGMPSLKTSDVEKVVAERKEDERPFSSLNNILEAHINVSSPFTLVFSVSPAGIGDVNESFKKKFKLRDAIKPLTEMDVTKNASTSWGMGLNITAAHQSRSESSQHKRNIFSTGKMFFFGRTGLATCGRTAVGLAKFATKHMSGRAQEWTQKAEKWNWIQDWSPIKADGSLHDPDSLSVNYVPEVRANSSHEDSSLSTGSTTHVLRSDLLYIDKHLEKSLAHLQQALSGGGFYATAMVYTDKQEVGESLSRSIRGALSGTHSYLRPMQIFNVDSESFFQLQYNLPIAQIMSESVSYEVLNCESACLALMLPDADLPGEVKIKRSVFYARPEETQTHPRLAGPVEETNGSRESFATFGEMAYFENQLHFAHKANETREFRISTKDLFKHIFAVGAPGGGKSYRTRHILNHIPHDVRLLILETAKREYGEWMHRQGKRLIRYSLGNSKVFPLRINPFYFDVGTSLKQHIAVLSDAIADLLPMEALIGPKLREAVENCYRKCGWDIETDSPIDISECTLPYPDMLMFNQEVANICESLTDYGPEVRSNYTGALKNRAAIFLDDVYQDIFAFDGNKSIDELFPPDADVVVEMEDMPPSEINMPAFIISVLLQRLRAYRFQKHGMYLAAANKDPDLPESDRFLVAIEEAHNVLSRKIEGGKGDERQSGKGGQLLNQVCRLLAEGRGVGLGIMVIDQSAHAIAQSVLSNTNIKIIFRVENGEELKTIGTSIGLEEKDWPDMLMLGEGECIVKSSASVLPVKLARLTDEPQYGTPCEISESVHLTMTYAQCRRVLDALFAEGVFSMATARSVAGILLEKCCWHRAEFLRYVWGRYLKCVRDGAGLELHLTESRKYVFVDELTNYYANQFRQSMRDVHIHSFFDYLDAIENGTDPSEVRLGQVISGAVRLSSVLCEDLNDGDRSCVSAFNENMKECGEVHGKGEDVRERVKETLRDFVHKMQSRDAVRAAYREIRRCCQVKIVLHESESLESVLSSLFHE